MKKQKKRDPSVILQRHLILEELRKFDVIDIVDINPLSQLHYLVEFTEEGEVEVVSEINWEYALFEAPMKELIFMMQRLLKLRVERHPKTIEANKMVADYIEKEIIQPLKDEDTQ